MSGRSFNPIKDVLDSSTRGFARNEKDVSVIRGTIIGETDSAIHFSLEEAAFWFPLSTVHRITRNPSNVGKDELKIDNWILKKKGLRE